jgi:hypothetical protein
VIYSRFRPSGDFDYFEVPGEAALGDDLPTPSLPAVNGIGFPSVHAGRALPVGAKWVGKGSRPIGFIAPMDGTKTTGKIKLGEFVVPESQKWLWAAAAFAGAAYIAVRLRLHEWRAA